MGSPRHRSATQGHQMSGSVCRIRCGVCVAQGTTWAAAAKGATVGQRSIFALVTGAILTLNHRPHGEAEPTPPLALAALHRSARPPLFPMPRNEESYPTAHCTCRCMCLAAAASDTKSGTRTRDTPYGIPDAGVICRSETSVSISIWRKGGAEPVRTRRGPVPWTQTFLGVFVCEINMPLARRGRGITAHHRSEGLVSPALALEFA